MSRFLLSYDPCFLSPVLLAIGLQRFADADAFVSRLKSQGGDVVIGDGVETILVESGRAKGVVLQSGRILEAEAVIAAVHPGVLIAMLPADALRPAYAERIAQLENTKGLFSVNLAVDADVHESLSYNIYGSMRKKTAPCPTVYSINCAIAGSWE